MLLIRREVRGNEKGGEFAFTQYIECNPPRNEVETVVGDVSLRWSNDDNTGCTIVGRSYIYGDDSLIAGEYFAAQPICSIKGAIQVVRESLLLLLFSDDEGWPFRRI